MVLPPDMIFIYRILTKTLTPMSSNLYWTPPPTEVKEHFLDLKYEIGRYFDEEYNGGSESWNVDEKIIPFLKGIIATGNDSQKKSAQQLINAIQKYGIVVLIIHN